MGKLDKMADEIRKDQETARGEFEFYENVYEKLSERAREYLKPRSREYKRTLADIREMILPAVSKICSVCQSTCCLLYNQERSIYMAKTIGGFSFIDYLLSRCDTVLPEPHYQNVEKNLCPFWDDGCILPVDARSYLCVRYFCDKIKKELDMKAVSRHLEKLKSMLSDLTLRELMSQ
jgi:hypothetical protein